MTPHPIHPASSIQPGSPGHTLLRRVLRVEAQQALIAGITLFDDDRWRMSLHDTGPSGTPPKTPDRDTAIHILWAMDDATAALRIASRDVAIAPGDTLTIPSGIPWSAAPSMILCEIAGPSGESEPAAPGMTMIAPTHGEETFHGYNRQTTYPSSPGISFERWKITQPLTFPDSSEPYAIVDLTEPLAMIWRGGTDLIGRGQCRIIPPGTGPITLLPDGLGYALIVSQRPRP